MKRNIISALICFILTAVLSAAASAETVSPATGNIERSSYIIVIVVAGVLAVAAIIAGIFTKKKKK